MSFLDIDQISRNYARGQRPALDGVSLQLDAGKLLALLGPSGSGKSTLLKIIAGIERPDGGNVQLGGANLLRIAAHRRNTVLMFQRPYLFPFLSVAENIAFGLRMRRSDRRSIDAAVRRMLELVELPTYGPRRPTQLSGGEQQRVALARALIVQPRLLMLDEPLSSLDPAVRQSLQEVIRRIQGELALTTVLVTHDLSEAVAMADQLGVLTEGRLVALGAPDAIFERPPNRTAARFVGVTTLLSGPIKGGILASPLGPLVAPPGCSDAPQATFGIRPERISLHANGGPNRLNGIVEQVTYRGDYSELLIRSGPLQLRARTSESAPIPGAQIAFELPPASMFVISDD
ncbi:MAG: ABC transporter ATP-binding protein [Oscillochloris sp.]|nr:ABC transporter ATP-binding protein [Oscillochloris sp.]